MSHPRAKIFARAAENVDLQLSEWWGEKLLFGNQCGSPIETILLQAVAAEIITGNHYFAKMLLRRDDSEKSRHIFYVRPQAVLMDWPVDFAFDVMWPDKGVHTLAVECDGHNFHERTKEQVARDRGRDRRLQEHAFPIFRFTGSEIWRDPCGCADQIIEWADNLAMHFDIEDYWRVAHGD